MALTWALRLTTVSSNPVFSRDLNTEQVMTTPKLHLCQCLLSFMQIRKLQVEEGKAERSNILKHLLSTYVLAIFLDNLYLLNYSKNNYDEVSILFLFYKIRNCHTG